MTSECIRPVTHGFGNALQIWWADLDLYAEHVRLDGLRPEEWAYAERMLFADEARRFLCARHMLYGLLAETLGRRPGKIDIVTNAFGKPALAGGELHFNSSRSGPEALIGLSRERSVGVDIERIRTVDDAEVLARAHFTEAESTYLRNGRSATTRSLRFLECWTRKEACVKALGLGLLIPLPRVEVGPAGERRSVQIPLSTGNVQLSLCSVHPSAHSVAAAALSAPARLREKHVYT